MTKTNISLGIADSIRSQLYDMGPMEAFDAAAIIIADLEAKGYVIVPRDPLTKSIGGLESMATILELSYPPPPPDKLKLLAEKIADDLRAMLAARGAK